MAIALKQSSCGSGSSSNFELFTTAAAGYAVGDCVFVYLHRLTSTDPTSTPAGWTLGALVAPGQAGARLYYKILGAGDIGATQTWSWAQMVKSSYIIASYTGVDATTPLATLNSAGDAASGSTVTYGSITSGNTWLVAFGSGFSINVSCVASGAPSGYTLRQNWWHTTPDTAVHLMDTNGTWGGGASNPSTSLIANAQYRYGVHVALSPAASGGSLAAAFHHHFMRGV